MQARAEETPTFKGGWGSSSLVMQWPSCKSKTQKKIEIGHYLLAIVALHQLYLLIYNYIRGLPHCSSKNTVTVLLHYLDLDCSIRVSQIIDAIELGSPSQL